MKITATVLIPRHVEIEIDDNSMVSEIRKAIFGAAIDVENGTPFIEDCSLPEADG